jgi:hypothetical protein
VRGVAGHARPILGDRDRALAALTLDTRLSFRHRPRRLITNRCLSLGITHLGAMPVPAHRLPSGTILLKVPGAGSLSDLRAVLCARVAAHDQRADLDRQVARLTADATDATDATGGEGR